MLILLYVTKDRDASNGGGDVDGRRNVSFVINADLRKVNFRSLSDLIANDRSFGSQFLATSLETRRFFESLVSICLESV